MTPLWHMHWKGEGDNDPEVGNSWSATTYNFALLKAARSAVLSCDVIHSFSRARTQMSEMWVLHYALFFPPNYNIAHQQCCVWCHTENQCEHIFKTYLSKVSSSKSSLFALKIIFSRLGRKKQYCYDLEATPVVEEVVEKWLHYMHKDTSDHAAWQYKPPGEISDFNEFKHLPCPQCKSVNNYTDLIEMSYACLCQY